ncbi:TonB-dependent receptor [bacterium]|nr:TonB-dependent receptor [bacterium]
MPVFISILIMVGLTMPSLEGTLINQDNQPLTETLILFVDSGVKVRTDNEGRFHFNGTPGQYRLTVFNQTFNYSFKAGQTNQVIIPTVTEVISVYPGTDEELILDHKDLSAGQPGNLTEALSGKVEAHQAGIGGLLSVASIGGLSKHRVQTCINGVRIEGDRRAGSDLGTLIPDLMNTVQVYRGGTSTVYGSEAIGGVIDVQLPLPGTIERANQLALAWSDNNERIVGSYLLKQPSFVLGAAYDQADEYESPDGTTYDGSYTRYNLYGTWQKQMSQNVHKFDFLFSEASDVGKPSSSSTVTVYPEYGLHLVGYHLLRDDFSFHLGATDQYLETEQGEDRSTLESLNFHTRTFYTYRELALGLELYTRQNMTAENELEDGTRNKPLDNASKWEIAPFVSWAHDYNTFLSTAIGGRFQYLNAENGPGTTMDDTFLTYFGDVGLSTQAGTIDLSLFRSYRFPNLEEYFYTGLTGRGYIEGNPDLKPERGYGGRISWRKEIGGVFLYAAYQLQDIEDFIEKYELEDDYYSYKNVGKARISDAMINVGYRFVSCGFSWSEGEDTDTDEPIDDIPPYKVVLNIEPAFHNLKTRLGIMHVGTKDELGPSEQEVESYTLVDAALSYDLWQWLTMSVKVNNLFNQTYLFSCDEKAVDAPGRSITVAVRTTF